MSRHEAIRWGILSTARIVERSFLPGLRAAGDGIAYAVASRDPERGREFAARNSVQRGMDSYEAVIEDDQVDVVYVPLPNSLHAEWVIKALEAGKAVLCEKPLTADLIQAEQVIGVARARAGLLWEAFVFLFREQSHRLQSVLKDGIVGDAREVQSSLHFPITNDGDIRFDPSLGGGALLDAGCYCLQLGRFVFQADSDGATAVSKWTASGVDSETAGILSFPGDRRLVFSCGFETGPDSPATILCSAGEIRMSHPFHPGASDVLEVLDREGRIIENFRSDGEPSFAAAIRHIHRVLWGVEGARYLASEDALGNAVALDLVMRSARSGRYEAV